MTLTLLMALAAYRVYRLLALDSWPPIAWARDRAERWLAEVWGDEWADLLTCPWCLGFYVSVAVVTGTMGFTWVELPVLQILAVSCLVGLIGSKLDAD